MTEFFNNLIKYIIIIFWGGILYKRGRSEEANVLLPMVLKFAPQRGLKPALLRARTQIMLGDAQKACEYYHAAMGAGMLKTFPTASIESQVFSLLSPFHIRYVLRRLRADCGLAQQSCDMSSSRGGTVGRRRTSSDEALCSCWWHRNDFEGETYFIFYFLRYCLSCDWILN